MSANSLHDRAATELAALVRELGAEPTTTLDYADPGDLSHTVVASFSHGLRVDVVAYAHHPTEFTAYIGGWMRRAGGARAMRKAIHEHGWGEPLPGAVEWATDAARSIISAMGGTGDPLITRIPDYHMQPGIRVVMDHETPLGTIALVQCDDGADDRSISVHITHDRGTVEIKCSDPADAIHVLRKLEVAK